MPNLLQTKKKPVSNPATNKNGSTVVDAQGNLVSDNQPQLGALAGAAGQAATPTTPGGALAIGASPDAAKMAGVPPSPQAPAQPAGAPGTPGGRARTLLDVQQAQEFQPRGQSEADIQRQRDSERLKATFGSVGDRVQTLVEQFQVQPIEVGDSDQAAPLTLTAAGAKLSAATQALAQKAAQSGDPASMRAAAEAIARETGVAPQAVDLGAYVATQTLASQLHTPSSLALDDRTAMQLGFRGGLAEIAKELGVAPEALRGKTLKDLEGLVANKAEEYRGNLPAARAAVLDPAAGPNERRAARLALQAAGVAGNMATDAQMQKLDQEIRQADVVEFMGERLPIDELLGSDRFTAVAAEWANSAPDSEFRKKLATEEPGLSRWMTSHEAVLQDAATALAGRIDGFEQLQQKAAAVAKDLAAKTGLTVEDIDRMMKAADPTYNPSRLATSVPVAPELLSQFVLTQAPAMGLDVATAAAQLSDLAKTNPAAFQKALGMGSTELRDIGLGDLAQQDRAKFQAQGLAAINEKDLGSTLQYVFGITPAEAGAFVKRADAERVAGVIDPAKESQLSILDANRDGTLDNPKEIAARAKALAAEGKLSAASSEGGKYGSLTEAFISQTPVDENAAQSEIDRLVLSGEYTPDRARETFDALNSRGLLTPAAKQRFETAGRRYNTSEFITNAMEAAGTGPDTNTPELRAVQAIRQLRREAKPYYELGWIDEYLAQRPDIAKLLNEVESKEAAAQASQPPKNESTGTVQDLLGKLEGVAQKAQPGGFVGQVSKSLLANSPSKKLAKQWGI